MFRFALLIVVALTACGDDEENLIDNDGDAFSSEFDCDDNNAAINPNAAEVCDGVDNDCNGEIDEGVTKLNLYPDTDADGFGDKDSEPIEFCTEQEGYVSNNGDCDDRNPDINPSAEEVCDSGQSVDEDCDGLIDDNDDSVSPDSQTAYFRDSDQDGYGSDSDFQLFCHAPTEIIDTHSTASGDCDDSTASTYPGATEICDGFDNDCDTTLSDEDGLATFLAPGEVPFNLTISGSEDSPYETTIFDDGTLNVCTGTHYVNLTLSGNIDVVGYGTGPEAVTLSGSGGSNSVITLDGTGTSNAIENLSVENGVGSQSLDDEDLANAGGGIACLNGADLTLRDVHVRDNESDFGTILGNQCPMTLENVDIYNNKNINNDDGVICTAIGAIGAVSHSLKNVNVYGNISPVHAGICMGTMDGSGTLDVTMDNVDIYENQNTGEFSVGWLYIFSQSLANVTLSLNDTTVRNNTKGSYTYSSFASVLFVGGYGTKPSHFEWTSSADGLSGVYNNGMPGVYARGNEYSFETSNVDFAESDSSTENDQFDVGTEEELVEKSSLYRAGDGVSFYCDNSLCAENSDGDDDPSDNVVSKTLGSSTGAYSYNRSTHFGGTIFKGDNYRTLISFEHFYLAPSACTYDYYILEAMDTNSDGDVSDEDWTVIWYNHNVSGTGNGWRGSGHVGRFFEPTREDAAGTVRDMYYAPTIGWTCPRVSTPARAYAKHVTPSANDLGLGQSWGTISSTSYDGDNAPLYTNQTVNVTTTKADPASVNGAVYLLRVRAVELD